MTFDQQEFDIRFEWGEHGVLLRLWLADNAGTLTSEELGVILQPAGALLRLVDSATGEPIPTLDEATVMADEALERAITLTLLVEVEAQRAEAAEARVAELLAEIERLRQGADNR